MTRVIDATLSLAFLALTAPLLVLAVTGIRLSSPGPVFYRAARVGLHGRPFEMLKFRTMHVAPPGAVITARSDPRIFAFGRLLRRLKIDELPQFLNVLRGEMSLVGPRPEDPKIVARDYAPWMMRTLEVRPGITSPGAIFYYAWAEALIDPARPEESYVEALLPPKIAIELAYMERATVLNDLHCILHTAVAILGETIGRPVPPSARDRRAAERWVPPGTFPETP